MTIIFPSGEERKVICRKHKMRRKENKEKCDGLVGTIEEWKSNTG